MIGIGCDIVQVARIKSACANDLFLKKVFCECERGYFSKYSDPWPIIAGHFAAKEAMAKSLGTGFSEGVSFCDLWVEHDSLGRPLAMASPKIITRWPLLKIELSISHEADYAIAYALAHKVNPQSPLH